MNPIIGIVGNILVTGNGIFPDAERAYVNNYYIDSVVKAGGIPLILPVVSEDSLILKQVELVDAIIISGGCDVDPKIYGESPSRELENISPARDYFDTKVIEAASSLGKPILGICRGMQILNVAFGGTLYQDISHIAGNSTKHWKTENDKLDTLHTVKINKGTILSSILPESITVNSFHHQAVKKLANGFIGTATSKDGVIEAIEKKGASFVLGVQWHPEMMVSENQSNMIELFKKLVAISENPKLELCM